VERSHLTNQPLALSFELVGKVHFGRVSRRVRLVADDVEELGVEVGVMLFEDGAVFL